jgi:hypothetical protein
MAARDSSVGPGQYETSNTIDKNTGRKVTIGGKAREESRHDSPGPGHYDVNDSITKDKARSMIIASTTSRSEIVSK